MRNGSCSPPRLEPCSFISLNCSFHSLNGVIWGQKKGQRAMIDSSALLITEVVVWMGGTPIHSWHHCPPGATNETTSEQRQHCSCGYLVKPRWNRLDSDFYRGQHEPLKRAWMTRWCWDHSGGGRGGLRDARVTRENCLMTSRTQQLRNKNTPWKKPEPTCLAVVWLLCTVDPHTDESYLSKRHGDGGTRLFSHGPGKGRFWTARLVKGQTP